MSVEITVANRSTDEAVVVRAFVAKRSALTQISLALAHKLGLGRMHDVYVKDSVEYFGPMNVVRWKISPDAIVISSSNRTWKCTCFPVIHEEAFYEIIIGQDVIATVPDILSLIKSDVPPTPGPAFNSNTLFKGENVRMAKIHEVPHVNEFFEYSCLGSSALTRLAVNKVTRQLVAMYSSSQRVYRYASLPKDLEELIDEGGIAHSLGKTMRLVKDRCPFQKISDFPQNTILIHWPTVNSE